MTNRPKAYSYLRFSNPDQMKGDSLRRQAEATQSYADCHGLDLDTELTFRDLGVSAFRGTNARTGALGAFLNAVNSGQVPKGSFLLVENLDRVSRQDPWDALPVFQQIINAGITIATLQDGKEYSCTDMRENPLKIMESLFVMVRANEESETKSRRLKAAWKNKKNRAVTEGHKLTRTAPAWLELRDGEFEVREDCAAVVRQIFELALKGHGKTAIAYRFNQKGVTHFGNNKARKANGWYPSYVGKILRNEAVIGRFQPMRRAYDPKTGKRRHEPDGPAIENYFPVIVDEEIYYRVQRTKPGVSGHKGKPLANILSGLVYCGKCGGKLHHVSKGRTPRHGSYLACDNARRKHTCDAKSVRYDPILNAVLNSLEAGELDIRAILSNGEADKRQEIIYRIDAIAGQTDELQTGTINLLDILSRQPSPAIEQRLAENESTVVQLRQDKADLEAELHSLKYGQDHLGGALQAWNDVKRAVKNGTDEEAGEVRVRLNGALKRLISRIDIGIVGDVNRVSNKPIWANFQKFKDHVEMPLIPITVTFHQEGRYLLIYADPKTSLGFVAGAIKADEPGKFRLSGHWSTLIKPGVLEAIF